MPISLSGMLSWILDNVWTLFSHVTGHSSFPKALSAQEEAGIIARIQAGDEAARQTLIEHNLRLVAHIAKKYAHASIDQDDLVSIGAIGLIKAVRSYKPESGRLAAYASRCIENEILMALRSNRKTRGEISLNEPIGADREGNEITLIDVLGTDENMVPDEVLLNIESSRAVRLLGQALEPRERTVIILRYGLLDGAPRPQHEVARQLGISRSYVSRIEKKALQKLRAMLDK